jgi:predicted TIM-barrel fold metal-dependent hydrolase
MTRHARCLPAALALAAAFGLPLAAAAAPATAGGPIIDMHVHAYALDLPPGAPACPGDQPVPVEPVDPREELDFSKIGNCPRPIFAAKDEADLMRGSIAALRKHNVRLAMTEGSPERVAQWRALAPDLILPGVGIAKPKGDLPVAEMRRLHAAGQLEVMGEAYIQYRGFRPDDPRYADYFALAEELDIPVGIHLGEGPPGTARFPGYGDYQVAMGSPLLLEPVLRKYPKLRIYVMHYGSPLVDEMIAMLFAYPNLYVDIACNNWAFPRAQFHDALKRLVDAGMGKRILFGSDQMYWPDAVGEAIRAVDEAPFLDAGQKRDILYNNAARFLRLTKAEIEAHHRPCRTCGRL